MQAYLLATIWRTARVFRAATTCTRQLTTAIAWYIWKGATFRVPISTLLKPKRQGGWVLIDIEAKRRAHLIGRECGFKTWGRGSQQRHSSGSGTRMDPGRTSSQKNDTDDIRVFISICAGHGPHYTTGNDETLRTFKMRVYNSLHRMAAATRESLEMRITLRNRDTKWT